MVFARTSKAAARLAQQFSSHQAKKRYAAVVEGHPLSQESLTDWLIKDEATHSSRIAAKDEPGAKEAKLRYSLLSKANGRALLDVELYTGRPHQIRVQLAAAGLPVCGDQRYHAAARPGEQIALYAYALTIDHPTLGEPMTFTCPPVQPAFEAFPGQTALLPAFSVCRGISLTDQIVAVDKNPGVEVEGRLLAELESILGPCYPVHRLDANTTGVVLLARTQQAQKNLLAAFKTHDLEKTYLAVVRGVPPERAKLTHYLIKDAEAAFVSLAGPDTPGAQKATLSYVRLATDGERSLLEIHLETGRTHQIRVQLAAEGYPVLGDDQYGDRAFNKRFHCRLQQLLCKKIVFEGTAYESTRELSL